MALSSGCGRRSLRSRWRIVGDVNEGDAVLLRDVAPKSETRETRPSDRILKVRRDIVTAPANLFSTVHFASCTNFTSPPYALP
jgi:hypothetical protein